MQMYYMQPQSQAGHALQPCRVKLIVLFVVVWVAGKRGVAMDDVRGGAGAMCEVEDTWTR